ncbi:hypothetical protein PAMC26510_14635 [Caballeronia sordidicola]|uniref:Uncharacterized protein n=1 Tax=Caballeronia sordidicola TaxID=196367 RepID=A0A242MVN0_CABSO|nr:hypothetical protein PAMC26510_14635 [Caballeronia sordidicola]
MRAFCFSRDETKTLISGFIASIYFLLKQSGALDMNPVIS